MDDLISRQAAIEALDVTSFAVWQKGEPMSLRNEQCNKVCRILDDMLANRPTERDSLITAVRKAFGALETEPQWIPCSERLPEAEDCPMDCLVTRKSKYIGNYTDMAVCEKNGMWTHEDWDAIVLGDVKDGKSTGLISTRDDNIIAWMPLPEPYREERTEE